MLLFVLYGAAVPHVLRDTDESRPFKKAEGQHVRFISVYACCYAVALWFVSKETGGLTIIMSYKAYYGKTTQNIIL